MAAQEMTFDAAPVKQDTPVAQAAAPQDSGMTFDSTPVKQDTPVPAGSTPANSMQAADNEQTPEGSAAAIAAREAQHPIVTGLNEAANDVWGTIKGMVTPSGTGGLIGQAAQTFEHIRESVPVFQAYENARANGKSIVAALGAANAKAKQIHDAQSVLAQRVDEFKKSPTQAATRAVGDAAALAATLWSGPDALEVKAPEAPVPAAADTAEADAAGMARRYSNSATHIYNPATREIEPIGAVGKVVEHNAAKSGLPVGAPETVAPTGEDIQPALQKGVRDVMADVAKGSGVEAPNQNSVRDAAKTVADQVLAKSKDAYSQLDEASGGRWQRFDDQLKNVRDKMREVSGIDDDKYAELEQKRNEIETSQAQLIEDLKESGQVDPELADQARENYRKAQALYDTDAQIKLSTSGRAGVGRGIEIVNPDKLALRLHKLYDSGRLQQAVGDDNAATMISHAEAAQTAAQEITEFVPSSPTGQQALKDLLRPNTEGRIFLPGAKTDFIDAFRDFDKLGPEEQSARFGADVDKARNYLRSQARRQVAKAVLKYGSIAYVAKQTGVLPAVLHALLS